ncbi:unnamed protein product [Mytilus coruscus]|uniref:Ig-like domain-containing protein n=1 Tax=Mytilus coruscus TaxID=42192 RepID=A0A6J8EWM7_MYTCO|nr:unnamed protein product [Mytilus coruscus]
MDWNYHGKKKHLQSDDFYGYFIVSQSLLRWDIKTTTVIYGHDATLSCNGIGCKPISIRKWIGGPTSDVLCFNNYSSNPAKYQLMYNETKPSFDLMIKSFNFTDTNCTYTCACGFFQYTHMLNLNEIDFVYPPDKDLNSKIKQEDGKLHIDMSMKVYPLPNCTIVYKKTVLPVETIIVKEEVGIKLYELKLEYTLSLDYTNCRENVSISCKVRSFEFPLLQQELDLCKGNKSKTVLPVETIIVKEEVGIKLYELKLEYTLSLDYTNCRENVSISCKVRSFEFPLLQQELDLCKDAKLYTFIWILLGVVCGSLILLLVINVKRRRKRGQETKRKRREQNTEQRLMSVLR